MKHHLIDLTKIHAINRSHTHAVADLIEGEEIDTLCQLKIRQLQQAEEKLRRDIDNLLDKYAHAHELAVVARPNHKLQAILTMAGIQSEEQ